ncbi:MAG: hypothetical protein JO290_00115 [Sphingomonadaceae bacterium]|nr:hypothetical protein [Sphingomonadaceae bacterium]
MWHLAELSYGDGTLWNLIAQANGRSHSQRIFAGEWLLIPAAPTRVGSPDNVPRSRPDPSSSCRYNELSPARLTSGASPPLFLGPWSFPPAQPLDMGGLSIKLTLSSNRGFALAGNVGYIWEATVESTFTTSSGGKPLDGVTISPDGSWSAEVKQKHESQLSTVAASLSLNFDPKEQTVSPSLGQTITFANGSHKLYSIKTTFQPPNIFAFSIESAEAKGKVDDLEFSGTISLAGKITLISAPALPLPPAVEAKVIFILGSAALTAAAVEAAAASVGAYVGANVGIGAAIVLVCL